MSQRYFTEEVLKEWVSQGYEYVLFTNRPDSVSILVRPVNLPNDLKGIFLYESHILHIDNCTEDEIMGIPFMDKSLKLVCSDLLFR